MSKAKPAQAMTIITDMSQIPSFARETEEHEFWSAFTKKKSAM